MPKNYSALIENIRKRSNPDNIILEKSLSGYPPEFSSVS